MSDAEPTAAPEPPLDVAPRVGSDRKTVPRPRVPDELRPERQRQPAREREWQKHRTRQPNAAALTLRARPIPLEREPERQRLQAMQRHRRQPIEP